MSQTRRILFSIVIVVVSGLSAIIFLLQKESPVVPEHTDRGSVSRQGKAESIELRERAMESIRQADRDSDPLDTSGKMERYFREREQQKKRLAWLQSRTDKVYGELALKVYSELVQKESPDMTWSHGISITLQSYLATDEFSGTRVSEVTCGTDICDARIHHENREALTAFWTRKSNGHMPWDTETYSIYERGDGDAFSTRLFFSRSPGDLSFHIRAREAMLQIIDSRGMTK